MQCYVFILILTSSGFDKKRHLGGLPADAARRETLRFYFSG